MARTRRSWAPAVVAVVAVAAAAVAIPMTASAASDLPAKTPEQVLALAASSHVTAFSGTVEQSSELGLPSLPSVGTSPTAASSSSTDATDPASILALLSGSHTARIYVDGATHARIQVLDQLAERDVIRNGSDLWVYDSKANTVSHATLAGHAKSTPTRPTVSPVTLAKTILAKLEPTSVVSVGPDASVAGRSAYTLVLRPKASDTLIGSVSIAVDSATGLPLRVQLAARGQSAPAVSVGFSALDLTAPAASRFSFTPPSGAKVTQLARHATEAPKVTTPKATTPPQAPSVTGSGWDAVVTIQAQGAATSLTASKLLSQVTTPVAGGRLFHTTLANILITDDGRIIAGSVSASRLEAVASAG